MAINILSIGNSFSVDAHRYIHYLAREEGQTFHLMNLYIAGCPFEIHFRNMTGDLERYGFNINGGEPMGFNISLKTALLAKSWDYITIQQASQDSPYYETYQPYANELCDYIRLHCPKAKLLVHQTWAYQTGSEKILKAGFENYDEMFEKVKESYKKLASDVKADGIIPSGEVFKRALELGIEKVHRDGFHATVGAGSFMLALLWYKYITQNSIDDVKFNSFSKEVTDEEYKISIQAVNDVLK